jgi:hypothetical protein
MSEIDETNEDIKWINNPEWCFQFFDNEPVPFAYAASGSTKEPLELQIYPIEAEALTFKNNGMTFKIFVREMSEETKNNIGAEKNESKD